MVDVRPTGIHIHGCPWQQRTCELGHSPDGEAHLLSAFNTWFAVFFLFVVVVVFFQKIRQIRHMPASSNINSS